MDVLFESGFWKRFKEHAKSIYQFRKKPVVRQYHNKKEKTPHVCFLIIDKERQQIFKINPQWTMGPDV